MESSLIARPVFFQPGSVLATRLAAQSECVRVHGEWIAQLRATRREARQGAMRWPLVERRLAAHTQGLLQQSAALAQAERRAQKVADHLRQRAVLAAGIHINAVIAAHAAAVNQSTSVTAASAAIAISRPAPADDRCGPDAVRVDGCPATARSATREPAPAAPARRAAASVLRVTPPSSSGNLRMLLAKLVHRALRAGEPAFGGQVGA